MMNIQSFEQEWDVLVIGGGAAGVFAAIAASKTGAKTLLIEKNGVLGGTITMAGVNYRRAVLGRNPANGRIRRRHSPSYIFSARASL